MDTNTDRLSKIAKKLKSELSGKRVKVDHKKRVVVCSQRDLDKLPDGTHNAIIELTQRFGYGYQPRT